MAISANSPWQDLIYSSNWGLKFPENGPMDPNGRKLGPSISPSQMWSSWEFLIFFQSPFSSGFHGFPYWKMDLKAGPMETGKTSRRITFNKSREELAQTPYEDPWKPQISDWRRSSFAFFRAGGNGLIWDVALGGYQNVFSFVSIRVHKQRKAWQTIKRGGNVGLVAPSTCKAGRWTPQLINIMSCWNLIQYIFIMVFTSSPHEK